MTAAASAPHDLPGGLVAAYAFWPDRPVLCLRSQAPLVGEDSPFEWVHVAYEGAWNGHPMGPFELTRERFLEAIRNHEAKANPTKLDFDHETEFALPGSPTPARGWVHELAIRDDEDGRAHLWARVEFGPEATRINREEGGYRFSSAVFDFGAIDRVSGEPIGLELRSLALTDDPFIDGQEPIRLSRWRTAAEDESMATKKKSLGAAQDKLTELYALLNIDAAALDESEKANPWGVVWDRVNALTAAAAQEAVLEGSAPALSRVAFSAETDKLAALFSLLGVDAAALSDVEKANPWGVVFERVKGLAPSGAPQEQSTTAASANNHETAPTALANQEIEMTVQELIEATGMSEQELVDALKQIKAGASEEDAGEESSAAAGAQTPTLSAQMRVQEETVRTLNARLASAEEQLRGYREREADEAVDALVASGRLLDTGRKTFRDLYLSNRETYEAAAAALPQAVPTKGHASSASPPTQDSPAIDENDPEVKRLRTVLGRLSSLTEAQKDAHIRKSLAAKKNETRV